MGIEYFQSESFNVMEIKTCSNDLHAYKSHVHRELSLGFIERGATLLEVGSREYCLRAGDAILISPLVSHKCQPLDLHNWAFTMMYIRENFAREFLEHFSELGAIGILKLRPEQFRRVRDLVVFLKSCKGRFDREVALGEVLSDMAEAAWISISLEDRKRIHEIREYLEAHYLDSLNLQDLEERFCLGKFTIIRGFKEVCNTTPNAFQLQLRVEHAKRLLAESEEGLSAIALASGFYDQAYFSREFKRSYGVTPLQYRQSLGK